MKGTSDRNESSVTLNISTVSGRIEMKKRQSEQESNDEEKRTTYFGRRTKTGFQKNKCPGTKIMNALEMKNINSNIQLDRISIEM
jgi:hypothetical protein